MGTGTGGSGGDRGKRRIDAFLFRIAMRICPTDSVGSVLHLISGLYLRPAVLFLCYPAFNQNVMRVQTLKTNAFLILARLHL